MKKCILAILSLILTGLLAPSISQANVTVMPSSVNVVRGQTNTVVITYRFASVIGSGLEMSSQGIYFTPDTAIGINGVPVTTNIINGIGTITETAS